MIILRIICDRCGREEIEDDADGWTEAEDGRDLCPRCSA